MVALKARPATPLCRWRLATARSLLVAIHPSPKPVHRSKPKRPKRPAATQNRIKPLKHRQEGVCDLLASQPMPMQFRHRVPSPDGRIVRERVRVRPHRPKLSSSARAGNKTERASC